MLYSSGMKIQLNLIPDFTFHNSLRTNAMKKSKQLQNPIIIQKKKDVQSRKKTQDIL